MSLNGNTQAGFFQVEKRSDVRGVAARYFNFNCPCGCGKLHSVRLYRGMDRGAGGPGFHITGSDETPTIEPGLGPLAPCGFHGYMRGGNWNAYGDGPALAKDCFSGVTPAA